MSDLARIVKMTYVQIRRYETKKANPSADVRVIFDLLDFDNIFYVKLFYLKWR